MAKNFTHPVSHPTAILFYLLLVTFGCKKEEVIKQDNLIQQEITTESIKKSFYQLKLDSKLTKKLNDTLEIISKPDWEHVRKSLVSDTVDYRYVPLKPVTISGTKEKEVKLVNYSAYVIVKNGSVFYESYYYPDSVKNGNELEERFLYNGKLTMKDMITGTFYILVYQQGKPSQPYAKNIDLIGIKDSSDMKTMNTNRKRAAWETRCRSVETCNWYTVCNNTTQVYSNSPGQCTYPTAVTDCDYSASWQRSASSYTTVCDQVWVPDPPTDPTTSPWQPTFVPLNQAEVSEAIRNKPFALYIDNSCSVMKRWLELAKYQVGQSTLDRLKAAQTIFTKNGVMFPKTYVQDINSAYSAVVNMDFFPVKVTQLPIVNGQRLTAPQFMEYLRKNINNFVDTKYSKFVPYNFGGINDTQLWNSANPLNSLVAIDIGGSPDDASVITSKYGSGSWTFTTIHEPMYSNHPVSGHRTFGYEQNTDGSYIFYTRGVDRLTSADINAIHMLTELLRNKSLPFSSADALWKSFQEKIVTFISTHGGAASKSPEQILRPNWQRVKDVLDGKTTLRTLGVDCDTIDEFEI